MSEIPYCDKTWEPIGGCTHCSPGCANCWSERLVSTRFKGKPRYDGLTKKGRWTGLVKLFEDRLEQPLHYRDPKRVFVCSQADLFHPKVPFEFRCRLFETIANAGRHTYLILTKRAKEMREFFQLCEDYDSSEWPNVQLFVSICTQAEADEKIPILLQIPATVRGVSLEPLLEDMKIIEHLAIWLCELCKHQYQGYELGWLDTTLGWKSHCPQCGPTMEGLKVHKPLIHQVIIGAESGPKRRPCKLQWVRSLVQQCQAAGVAVYVKQLVLDGKLVRDMSKFPPDLRVRQLVK